MFICITKQFGLTQKAMAALFDVEVKPTCPNYPQRASREAKKTGLLHCRLRKTPDTPCHCE
jgi:hypothetical protein